MLPAPLPDGRRQGVDRETRRGNAPLRSQSSGWTSETAAVGISVPARSGRAAGHTAGRPAKSKKQ